MDRDDNDFRPQVDFDPEGNNNGRIPSIPVHNHNDQQQIMKSVILDDDEDYSSINNNNHINSNHQHQNMIVRTPPSDFGPPVFKKSRQNETNEYNVILSPDGPVDQSGGGFPNSRSASLAHTPEKSLAYKFCHPWDDDDDEFGHGHKKQKSNTNGSVPISGGEKSHNDPNDERTSDATGAIDPTSRDYYFDSYAHHAIHEEMLKDEVRTKTYEMAIMQNKHLFQDKIVLDVGCGTGILSMFAAQAGAKHVYAIDCSSIIELAQKIIERNGFADRVTTIRGKVEEIDLPVPTVDIIVSEWMGYFLLYESMLDTVLFARDKWLVPNGIVFPDKAVLYLSAIEDANVRRERFDFWDDVYGFDMSPIKEVAIKEPVVDIVDAKALVTDAVPILHIDILTCTKDDLNFASKFKLQAHRNDYIHGLVAYFECAFTQIHKPIGFSTSPYARYTHWKQTILYLQDTITICAGETLTGEISCKPNKRNRRDLDIDISISFQGRYYQVDEKQLSYRLR